MEKCVVNVNYPRANIIVKSRRVLWLGKPEDYAEHLPLDPVYKENSYSFHINLNSECKF